MTVAVNLPASRLVAAVPLSRVMIPEVPPPPPPVVPPAPVVTVKSPPAPPVPTVPPVPTGTTFTTFPLAILNVNFHINNTDAAVRTAMGVDGAVTYILTGPGPFTSPVHSIGFFTDNIFAPDNYTTSSFIDTSDTTNFDIPRSGVTVSTGFLELATDGPLPAGDYSVAVNIPNIADGSNIQVTFEGTDPVGNNSVPTLVESIDGVSFGVSAVTATYDGANTTVIKVATPP